MQRTYVSFHRSRKDSSIKFNNRVFNVFHCIFFKFVANAPGLLQTIHYDARIVVWQLENDSEPSCNDRNDWWCSTSAPPQGIRCQQVFFFILSPSMSNHCVRASFVLVFYGWYTFRFMVTIYGYYTYYRTCARLMAASQDIRLDNIRIRYNRIRAVHVCSIRGGQTFPRQRLSPSHWLN